MDNNLDLKKIWIDRETFQKAFRFLKTSSSISKREKEFKSYPKLLVSGFYNKESDEWTDLKKESLTDQEAEITSPLTDGLSSEGLMDYIKIQLEKNDDPVYEVRHPSEMYAEIYRASGEYETIPFPESLIHAVIPIIGEGKFKIRFFRGRFLFDEEGNVVERGGLEKISGEIDFTWPER